MAAASESPDDELYSTAESAKRLRINPVLLRWLVHTGGVTAVTAGVGPSGRAGFLKMFTAADLARVDAILTAADPDGLFRSYGKGSFRGIRPTEGGRDGVVATNQDATTTP